MSMLIFIITMLMTIAFDDDSLSSNRVPIYLKKNLYTRDLNQIVEHLKKKSKYRVLIHFFLFDFTDNRQCASRSLEKK